MWFWEDRGASAWGLMMTLCQPCSNQPRRGIFCTLILLEVGGVVSLSH